MRVSVIGGSTATGEERDRARAVGRLLAERGHTVVCGGRGGVMAAACRGARERDGHTVGILPGTDPADANDFIDTAVVTGMGAARNSLVVLNGEAVVAVDGGPGTLSELGHALDQALPVAGLGTHRIEGLDGVKHVDSPRAAVDHVEGATPASR